MIRSPGSAGRWVVEGSGNGMPAWTLRIGDRAENIEVSRDETFDLE
jgi:hypothetical protein